MRSTLWTTAGDSEPRLHGFAIQPLLTRVLSTFEAAAEAKGLRLSVVPSRAVVRSDPLILQRVLFEIVDYWARRATAGGAAVMCRHRGTDVHIQIWIANPANELPALVRLCHQRDPREAPEAHGHDEMLGARSFAMALGHSFGVDDCPGRGTRVTICASGAEEALQVVGLRVLLLDDNAVSSHHAQVIMRTWGCHVIAVSSLEEAKARVDMEQPPELIFADFAARTTDHVVAALNEIRRNFGRDIPAIVVTDDTSMETARHLRSQGLALLYKPVSPSRMRAMLARYGGHRWDEPAIGSPD